MITYEIKKQKLGFVGAAFKAVGEMFTMGHAPHVQQQQGGYRRLQQQNDDGRPPILGTTFMWGKFKYAQYLAANVSNKYRKGQFVTLRMYPFMPGKLPNLHVIEEIHEIHYMVNWDSVADEPRCIRISMGENLSRDVGPSSIRTLSEEEQRLVDVQNQEVQIVEKE